MAMIDEAAAIAEFLRIRGATRCPTAFVAPSAFATLHREDIARLQQHQARQAGATPNRIVHDTTAALDASQIRRALKDCRWTQKKLAEHIGVSSASLSAALTWGGALDPSAAERLRAWLDQHSPHA